MNITSLFKQSIFVSSLQPFQTYPSLFFLKGITYQSYIVLTFFPSFHSQTIAPDEYF